MATTATKPRSAKAAASDAASVSRATAARKVKSGNVSGERAAKGAQARRRAAATSEDESSASSATASNGRRSSGKSPSASGNGRSSSGGGGSSTKPRSKSRSNSKPTSKSSKASPSKSTGSTATKSSKSTGSTTKPSKGTSAKKRSSTAKTQAKRSAAAKTKDSATAKTQAKRSSAAKAQTKRSRSAGSDNGSDHPVAETGKHVASALFKPTYRKKHPIARKVAKTALKKIGQKSLSAGGGAIRSVAEGAGSRSREAVRAGVARIVEDRPPIQASVDVAAPLSVVWSEWMSFEWFTEGIHNIADVERDGDELTGEVCAPHERDWRAEIVDEREEQAFAWRSTDGTDCAGLVTFHKLGDRLTRIEADLDVMPTNPAETFLLTLPIPARRAERQLQLFKAHVEFINPDVYETQDSDDEQTESDQDGERENAETDGADQDANPDGADQDAGNDN